MKRFFIASASAIFLIWLAVRLLSEEAAVEQKAASEQAFIAKFQEMKPLAEKGDAKAQYIVASLYQEGKGVMKNLEMAANWYAKAASQGLALAQYRLGAMHESGQGAPKDILRAIELYRLAAGQGNDASAQFAMGQLYFTGNGVQVDYAESFAWHLKAANNGHGGSQFIVGSMFQDGWAGKIDLAEAYKWYTLAIPNKSQALAANPLYDPVKVRQKLMARMTKFQISQGEQRVKEYKIFAAVTKNP